MISLVYDFAYLNNIIYQTIAHSILSYHHIFGLKVKYMLCWGTLLTLKILVFQTSCCNLNTYLLLSNNFPNKGFISQNYRYSNFYFYQKTQLNSETKYGKKPTSHCSTKVIGNFWWSPAVRVLTWSNEFFLLS